MKFGTLVLSGGDGVASSFSLSDLYRTRKTRRADKFDVSLSTLYTRPKLEQNAIQKLQTSRDFPDAKAGCESVDCS